jgi:hypothetical protein
MKNKVIFISSVFDDISYSYYVLINKKRDEVFVYNKKDNNITYREISNLNKHIKD